MALDSNAALSGAPSDLPGASMFCCGLEKLCQKVLSCWYFRVKLQKNSPPWKSGWRLPTGTVQLPNSSWYKPSPERRILLSSEGQQCLGGTPQEGVREKNSGDRAMQVAVVAVSVLHLELCSQAQAGILFPTRGDAGSPDSKDRPLEKDQEVNTSGHSCAVGPEHW